MVNWFENLLLRFLNVIPISPYHRGQTKRAYFEHKKSVWDSWHKFRKRDPSHYQMLVKLLRKHARKNLTRRLISRDQRLFNGQVLAAEAFKWDMDKILVLLTDAKEDIDKFGVHRKHQKQLKDMIHLLVEHLNDPDLNVKDNHVCKSKDGLDRIDFEWEGVKLPCHSYYDVLITVLSVLGRASKGATRHNYYLALLIIIARFVIVVAGEHAKTIAPSLVSIMFTDEEVDPEGLNIIMGAIIPWHEDLKEKIRRRRYDFLIEEGLFALLGMFTSWDRWLCGQCAETFALVLLKRNTSFTGRSVGGLALKIRNVLELDEIDDVRLEDLLDPCKNCQEGLKQCGVDLDQFQVGLMV